MKTLSIKEFKKMMEFDSFPLSLRNPTLEEKYQKRDKSKDPINLHNKSLIFLPNDYPYHWEKGIEHWILWYHGNWEDLEKNYKKWILNFTKDYELTWINTSRLRSIKGLPHCHFLLKNSFIEIERINLFRKEKNRKAMKLE